MAYELSFHVTVANHFGARLDEVAAVVRREIDELWDDGLHTLSDLIFHCVEFEDAQLFCTPDDGGRCLHVAMAAFDKFVPDSGPLEGKPVPSQSSN